MYIIYCQILLVKFMFIYIVTLLQMISHASNIYDLCLHCLASNDIQPKMKFLSTTSHETSPDEHSRYMLAVG